MGVEVIKKVYQSRVYLDFPPTMQPADKLFDLVLKNTKKYPFLNKLQDQTSFSLIRFVEISQKPVII